MKKKLLLAATLAGVAALLRSSSTRRSDLPALQAVPELDLQRYAGTWYEQARLPLVWQSRCAGNTMASYTLRDDGLVDVLNSCEDADGQPIEARGVARRSGEHPAQLEVRFAPELLAGLSMVWGDYWVLELDPDYRWAVVGSPDRKHLWFLTRDKHFPKDRLDILILRAAERGFDTTRLKYTPQY